ncbi:histidine kinase [Flavobacterium foetidum]|uniref:histidine kinase n=1 Tax=Flavobacterium foetidum TaxID=2026681 RepID=UPI001074B5A0|nr:histidine kinase [Flavobacterium foetidum]KAF2517255.1 Pr2TM family membrane protein [Flavobacterium foetidum]
MTLKPNLFKAFIVGGIVFLFTFLIRFATYGFEVFQKNLFIYFFYCMLYSVVLYIVNAALFELLDRVFKEDRFSPRRISVGFVSSFFISLFVIFILRMFTQVVIEQKTIISFLANESAADYVSSSVLTFIVLLVFHSLHFYKLYQENKVTQQKIIAGTANAKFESLKNQIDPHFLFNSLNVLSSLIEENPDNAQRFTTSLSKIYRYVLEQRDKELVSVEDELSFAKTYMNLLKMRFENSLFYEIPTAGINPDAKVVPLSLQLLLENTVKHNVVSEQKPLHIRIFIEKDYLVIQNDFQKKEVLRDRKGVGLQNIVDRYGIVTKRRVIVEQDEKNFTVKIPILTKQITVMETSLDYNNAENRAYFRAKKRVEELKGFYGNIISYCCVIPFLIFINLTYSPKFQWFWFSAIGWGFGVVMHAFKVFGYSSNWEERKIREILEKENNQKNWK